ncbi:MAG TPA: two-component sensor histidine kinase [Chromatiaceae bacterium]|nr:MAG: HAMP domain-containing histidine kinase [Thiohalocapsa sp. PB-PSB1]HBG94571.1 two-component sensor histidine kinase [Chromatiaceae bacterium]HCS89403.1 two-component sensor histidine kinase [Chromatiaceae bacterium]
MPSSEQTSNAEPTGRPFPSRSTLTWLFLYRLILVALLILVFWFAVETHWLPGGADPLVARMILGIQASLILISGLLIPAQWPSQEQQIEIAVFLDIVIYTLLMHISGGVSTGLGLLPAIAVIAGAILMEGRLSLLFASLATLAVIAQQVYSEWYIGTQEGTYTQAGLLGLTYFAVALLGHVLSSKLQAYERLAARRKVDIADLSKLNSYIIQSMSTGVVVVDGEYKLLLLNHAARLLLGTPNARPGDRLINIAPILYTWFRRELIGANPSDPLLRLGDAELRPTLHLLGTERINGAMIYLRDNRELLRQAQEMKLASLGRLTASIAHNIRNPLSSVAHAAQLLAESATLGSDDRHLLDILRRNALRIDETVASVLELSRRHQPNMQELDLRNWLPAFCAEYRENHPNACVQLALEIEDRPLLVQVDARHLGQILRNLCDNACKYGTSTSEPAQITLSASHDQQRDALVVTIADQGPGVSEQHLRDIFEPFFTTSNSGTGLGLYAARELAEANAIRLVYSAGEENGARFSLIFAS